MITQMVRRHESPIEGLKSHDRVINLMHYDIEPELLAHCLDFHLISPDSILSHIFYIVIKSFIFIDERSIEFFVLFYIVAGYISVKPMFRLVSVNLIGNSSEQTVSVTSNFYKRKLIKLLPLTLSPKTPIC